MSNLEIVTDAVVVAKYGVLPEPVRRLRHAARRSSDGLPGVAGIGEKTAAGLLAAHGDLAGILAAAEAGEGMSAGVRAKLLAGLPYLAVAPEVVAVVRDLDLPEVDTLLRPLDDSAKKDAAALAERWALGAAMTRIVDILDTV